MPMSLKMLSVSVFWQFLAMKARPCASSRQIVLAGRPTQKITD